jgi:predicted AAA+ superfamily ATPase
LDEIVPLDAAGLKQAPEQQDLAGRIAESVAGYFLASLGLSVAHQPARQDAGEIDFIVTAGDYRVPVEIKYQSKIDPVRDIQNLQAFTAKAVNRAPVGVIVTREDTVLDLPPNIVAIPLKSLLLAH